MKTDSIVLVAERQRRIVGYVYAAIEPLSWKDLRDECGFIHDLLVADVARRARHRRGAARMRRSSGCASSGMPRVVLGTAAQNETARRLVRAPRVPADDGRDDA